MKTMIERESKNITNCDIEQLKMQFQALGSGQEMKYPGFEKDFAKANEALFQKGNDQRFTKIYNKICTKTKVFEEYQVLTRLKDLKSLEVNYPGCKRDKRRIKAWIREHPPSNETNALFQDKLQGLKNKHKIYWDDRSHPHLLELDKIHFSYAGWEVDYEITINAHCNEPAHSYPDAIHRMKEKESLYNNKRCHWRLQVLDSLQLSYPGSEEDILRMEEWHLNNANNGTNTKIFKEKIENLFFLQMNYKSFHQDRYSVEEEEVGKEEEEEEMSQSVHVGAQKIHKTSFVKQEDEEGNPEDDRILDFDQGQDQRINEVRFAEEDTRDVIEVEWNDNMITVNREDFTFTNKISEEEKEEDRQDEEEIHFVYSSDDNRSFVQQEKVIPMTLEKVDGGYNDDETIADQSVVEMAISASLRRIRARRQMMAETNAIRYNLSSPESSFRTRVLQFHS